LIVFSNFGKKDANNKIHYLIQFIIYSIMQAYDTLPESLRKLIFSFVWPELTVAKLRQMYEDRGLDVELVDKHLYEYANEKQEIKSRLVDMGGGFGNAYFNSGISRRILKIYKRNKRIDDFMDYFRKKGIISIDIWGLLVDKEREEFLKTFL